MTELVLDYPPGAHCPYKRGDVLTSPVQHGARITHFQGTAIVESVREFPASFDQDALWAAQVRATIRPAA